MTNDLISRAEAQTAIQFAARMYTVAHEKHSEGQVVWSDILINLTDAMNVLRDLPSAQPEQRWIPVTEESVIQAGYEGKEVRFRIRGRLFAIRELAQ